MVTIPNGVNFSVDGINVTAKGPKGEVKRVFPKRAVVKVEGNKVLVSVNDKALQGTSESMLANMAKGVSEGYKKHLKALYAHFPISVEVKGKDILIKNFLGEKQPRKTKVAGSTKVEVKGQNITLSGPSKEDVGQTAANMKSAVKIKEKDGRIFQDGIYDTQEGA